MRLAILLALGCLTLAGQEARKVDFTQVLMGIDGKPLNGDVKPALTLGDIAVTALHSTIEEDKTMSGLDKFKMDELARKIYKSKAATLSVEDLATIKTRIGKVYGPLVIGPSWRLLDPSLVEKPPAPKAGQ